MEETTLRLPRIGVIKHPKEGDWFLVPPEIEAITGPKPKRLEVILASDVDSENYDESYRRYTGKVARCVGRDGVGRELVNINDKKRVEKKCPCSCYDGKECQIVGALNVIIPNVSLTGVYTIYSHGKNTRAVMQRAMPIIRQRYGRVEGVPLVLSRVPIMTGGSGQRRRLWIINVAPAGEAAGSTAPAVPETYEATETAKFPDNQPRQNSGRDQRSSQEQGKKSGGKDETGYLTGLTEPQKAANEAVGKPIPAPKPLTKDQSTRLNALMKQKGLSSPEDRIRFFNYALGAQERTLEFGNTFITKFDDFYNKWKQTAKRQ